MATDTRRLLGDDHPETLASHNDLAASYRDAGLLSEAIDLHEQTLEARRRVLGEDHPRTQASRDNLATAYRAVGHQEDAARLYTDP